jgi:hypothetical protein
MGFARRANPASGHSWNTLALRADFAYGQSNGNNPAERDNKWRYKFYLQVNLIII